MQSSDLAVLGFRDDTTNSQAAPLIWPQRKTQVRLLKAPTGSPVAWRGIGLGLAAGAGGDVVRLASRNGRGAAPPTEADRVLLLKVEA